MRAFFLATLLTFITAGCGFSFVWLFINFPIQTGFALIAGVLAFFWAVVYDELKP